MMIDIFVTETNGSSNDLKDINDIIISHIVVITKLISSRCFSSKIYITCSEALGVIFNAKEVMTSTSGINCTTFHDTSKGLLEVQPINLVSHVNDH